jgi:excisionase family DNA binding protein
VSTQAQQTVGGAGRYGASGHTRSPAHRPLAAADVMTAAEVAELLHVSKSTVEDWARRAIVPSKKVGRRRLYIRSRIEALLLDDHADLAA